MQILLDGGHFRAATMRAMCARRLLGAQTSREHCSYSLVFGMLQPCVLGVLVVRYLACCNHACNMCCRLETGVGTAA